MTTSLRNFITATFAALVLVLGIGAVQTAKAPGAEALTNSVTFKYRDKTAYWVNGSYSTSAKLRVTKKNGTIVRLAYGRGTTSVKKVCPTSSRYYLTYGLIGKKRYKLAAGKCVYTIPTNAAYYIGQYVAYRSV